MKERVKANFNRRKGAVKVKATEQLLEQVVEAEDTKEQNRPLSRGEDNESIKQLIEWGEKELDDRGSSG